MTRVRFIAALVLLVAVTVSPAGASTENTTAGIISLRLTDAETSYLGVMLEGDEGGESRPMRNVRLPVKNDGSNLTIWGSSIPLQVRDTQVIGNFTEVRVEPRGFNLIGTEPWKDAYGSFTYYVRLVDKDQPQSVLYFARGLQSAPFFRGTLYIAAVLHMIDLETGAASEQKLFLALNVDGKWVDEPAVSLLDSDLSSILPFTERDALGRPIDRYVCVNETHPWGSYCLQISPTLLNALGGI
jgi:hypothetical protein